MKRSEMLEKLEQKLYDFEYFNQTTYRKAQLLLELIESNGMLPPKRYTQDGEEPSDPRYHGLNGWEPEEDDRYCGAV